MSDLSFEDRLKGSFTSILRWDDLAPFWQRMLSQNQSWYIYAVGEAPPETLADQDELNHFVERIDQLLRQEHDEDYCGIVFANHLETPSLVKIYDPNNLGVSCGFSENPPLPGWILSTTPPTDISAPVPLPANRKRWWQKLWD